MPVSRTFQRWLLVVVGVSTLLLATPDPLADAKGKAKGKAPKAPLAEGDVVETMAQLRDLNGKVLDLGLRCGPAARMYNPARPKALLLDIYMTTCVPCNAALPLLGELAAKLEPRGLRTLLISLDGTEHAGPDGVSNATLREKVAAAHLADSNIVRDPGQVLAEDLDVVTNDPAKGRTVSVPRTFLLDEDCRIRGLYTSLEESRQLLEESFEKILTAPPPDATPGKGKGKGKGKAKGGK